MLNQFKQFTSGLLFAALLVSQPFYLPDPVEAYSNSNNKIVITKSDLEWIGKTIYKKECNSDPSRLVAWNPGEAFASLGIGHFIWYPKGKEGPFEESFPAFLAFAKKRGTKIPLWLHNMDTVDCPWKSRQHFYGNINSYRMNSLRHFLMETMHEQSLFIVMRFKQSLPKIIQAAPKDKRNHIRKQFFRVADSSKRLYALIDYVNFKGEGIRYSERYNNQGWGLLQVLEEMQGSEKGRVALCEFARAAETVLLRRVSNAPTYRNEHRWIKGWKNRVNFYRTLEQRYL